MNAALDYMSGIVTVATILVCVIAALLALLWLYLHRPSPFEEALRAVRERWAK